MIKTWKRKLSALVLCLALLLTLCGCRTKQSDDVSLFSLPLDEASINYLESAIFGKSPDDIIEELGLSEDEYEEMIPPGLLIVERPITAAGKEFSEIPEIYNGRRLVTFIFSSGVREEAMCSSVVYRCRCESAEELAELAEAAYQDAEKRYGMGPNHGHFTSLDYLCGEGVFDAIRESGDDKFLQYIGGGWGETWVVGEYSYLDIAVFSGGERGGFEVEWSYTMLPEEWTRFYPELKPRFYLRPQLQYGYCVDDWPEEYREKAKALMRERFSDAEPDEE